MWSWAAAASLVFPLLAARKQVGINGTVICVDGFKKSINRAMSVNCADEYLVVNATDAIAMYEEIMDATEGHYSRQQYPEHRNVLHHFLQGRGSAYFFMATSLRRRR